VSRRAIKSEPSNHSHSLLHRRRLWTYACGEYTQRSSACLDANCRSLSQPYWKITDFSDLARTQNGSIQHSYAEFNKGLAEKIIVLMATADASSIVQSKAGEFCSLGFTLLSAARS